MQLYKFALHFFCFFYILTGCNHTSNNEVTPQNTVSMIEDSLIAITKTFPDSLLPKENLLQFYRDSGWYDKAISANLTFIHRDSLNPRLYHILGLLYLENNDSTNAIKAFSQAYNMYNNPTDLIYAGAIYAKKNDDKALKIADTLLKNFKALSSKEAWLIKGIYFSGNGLSQKAISCFDSAIYVRYSFTEAYLEKAKTLKSDKRFNEAILTLEKAVTINNNLPDAYFILGECYEQIKDIPSAIASYERTLFYDREYMDAKIALRRLRP